MLSAGAWRKNQVNTILFVLVDASGVEVFGLGSSFSVEISKAGAAFAAGIGTGSEIGDGWYAYEADASEADTSGPVAVKITGTGAVQQNLEYVVEDRLVNAVSFTYTVTSSVDSSPIDGVYVAICTDPSGNNVVWTGFTDAFGVARDVNGELPRLDPGTYYIYRQRVGYIFSDPDTETVS